MKPKGSQNGAEIDAKTHQKAMPKLVSKKIITIMKLIKKWYAGTLEYWLLPREYACLQKIYISRKMSINDQNNIKNYVKNHPNINEKSM